MWQPEESLVTLVQTALKEISRVLKHGMYVCMYVCMYARQITKHIDTGRFLSITFDQPHFRKPFLCKPEFKWYGMVWYGMVFNNL